MWKISKKLIDEGFAYREKIIFRTMSKKSSKKFVKPGTLETVKVSNVKEL